MRSYSTRRFLLVGLLYAVGLAGVTSTVLFWFFADDVEMSPATRDLWASFSVETVMVWLTLVAIERLVSARAVASSARNDLRSFLNFIGGIARDMAPDYYTFRLNDLEDECYWGSSHMVPKTKKHLKVPEAKAVVELMSLAEEILQGSRGISQLKAELEAARHDEDTAFDELGAQDYNKIWRHEVAETQQIDRLYRLLESDYRLSVEELTRFDQDYQAALETLSNRGLPQPICDTICRKLALISDLVWARPAVEAKIDNYRSKARELSDVLTTL